MLPVSQTKRILPDVCFNSVCRSLPSLVSQSSTLIQRRLWCFRSAESDGRSSLGNAGITAEQLLLIKGWKIIEQIMIQEVTTQRGRGHGLDVPGESSCVQKCAKT